MKEICIKTVEEMNEILRRVRAVSFRVLFQKYDGKSYVGSTSYVDETPKYINVVCTLGGSKPKKFKFSKTGDGTESKDVVQILRNFGKSHKPENITEILGIPFNNNIGLDGNPIGYREIIGSASPIRESNGHLYGGKATPHCYEYDIEHCYGQALKLPVPDLTTLRMNGVVEEGEVGFYQYGCNKTGYNDIKCTFTPGRYATWIFKLKESPYKHYVEKLEKRLEKATTKEERDYIKDHFRIFVGSSQKTNPFLRAIIVQRGTMVIRELEARSNSRTIYISTDSIVTEGPLDNPNNNMFGFTFKCKHADQTFKLKDKCTLNYQWDLEMPKINGINSLKVKGYNETHDTPFDILKDWDKLPKGNTIITKYSLNRETLQIMEVKTHE